VASACLLPVGLCTRQVPFARVLLVQRVESGKGGEGMIELGAVPARDAQTKLSPGVVS